MTSLRRKKWEQVCPFFNSKRFQNVCMNEKKKKKSITHTVYFQHIMQDKQY